jgi:hypothetical protein
VKRLVAGGLLAAALCPFAGAANQSFSPVIVTRDSLALKCSPRVVTEVLLRFEKALDAGDRKALDSLFARDRFLGFSLDGPIVRDRGRLVRHLLRLHARGVGVRLLAVDVGNSWVPHSVGMAVSLLEVGGSSRQLSGKAEFDCRRRQIYVWNVGAPGHPSPCPEVPSANALRTVVACSRTGRAPLAQEVSRDFTVDRTPLKLPGACRPGAVRARVESALRAFDLAGATAFARNFTGGANMQPYTASKPLLNLGGRSQIAAFTARRTARGDGWTAARLSPPTGTAGLPATAVYGLTLRVTWNAADAGVKLVIDCRSGLIARWVGPALAEPH